MAKLLINDTTLSAIGNAIRTKNGSTDTYKPSEMPNAILTIAADGISHTFSGDCSSLFAGGYWDFVIEQGGVGLKTAHITDAGGMFSDSEVVQIPFEINLGYKTVEYTKDIGPSLSECFFQCENLVKAPKINSYSGGGKGALSTMYRMFYNCYSLREIDLSGIDWANYRSYDISEVISFEYMFYNCFSLRSIPEATMNELYYGNENNRIYMFYKCHCLDELRGVRPVYGDTMASNFCTQTYRLKDFTFCEPVDGENRFNISLNLTTCGYNSSTNGAIYMRKYMNDANDEKRIIDDATYQALKDDPDAWTTDVKYSRYNKASALRTIASLPQCGEGYTSTDRKSVV